MRQTLSRFFVAGALLALAVTVAPTSAQKEPDRPPHGQDKLPGPALKPDEAIKKMTVPDGFSVELVAAEPDLVNPTAMTFDEQGRIWVCESVEYPRSSAGVGKDRIKVLEDADGDGKVDKTTIFAEGLNIPCAIAVGHGGVWVSNAPDILFFKIGPNLKAAGPPEVVATGFGRADTHELPNSFIWGPDGWLYGLNGVFNPCKVKQGDKEFNFTCAMYRIHPKTREFQIFCEGTSNPWGIAFDTEGSAFVSACVIDHLWHLVETGYYHRQGGPYPPFTWKAESIVKHKHQKAAYCGLVYFDSDAYPAEYRDKLYMGNIHGGCINADELTRDGSTYFGKLRPDFLTANDAWFMPVSQKVGPDGCLYVLDWYDRYHCYQDARRDPAGIDRLNGRIYRVRYKGTPRAPKFDLAKETDAQLVERLGSPNVYFRETAQRVLTERASDSLNEVLERVVLNRDLGRKQRLHALFARVGGASIHGDFQKKLLAEPDPAFRAWAIRAASNWSERIDDPTRAAMDRFASIEDNRDVLLQVAIAARKLEPAKAFGIWLGVLGRAGDDKLLARIVWQNLHPKLEEHGATFVALLGQGPADFPAADEILKRTTDRILSARAVDVKAVAGLMALVTGPRFKKPDVGRDVLLAIAKRVQTGEIKGPALDALRAAVGPTVAGLSPTHVLAFDAAVVAASFKEPKALDRMAEFFANDTVPDLRRLLALEALVPANDARILPAAAKILTGRGNADFRGAVLGTLSRLDAADVAKVVLEAYPKLDGDLAARGIDVLATRPTWGKALVAAVEGNRLPKSAVNANHLRKLLGHKDADLVKGATALWGRLREDRNPEREKVVKDMEDALRKAKGDALKGAAVFTRVCGQCHKIHGEGQEVGPDLTGNGRSTFAQLLSNTFDPSLVIGTGYQAVNVITTRGQALTGLLVEETPQRIVLKVQGGKVETVARGDVEEYTLSKLSLMPEGMEKQLTPQEAADLFAFLCLDKHPKDPTARKIPGAP